MSSNYASELIGIQNQNEAEQGVGPNGILNPTSMYKELQQGFENSLQSAQNSRANQQLDMAKQTLDFNQDLQTKNYDLTKDKFDLYKNIQEQMFPIQKRQQSLDADLTQYNLSSQPDLQAAKQATAKKQVDSQNELQYFGNGLASMTDEDLSSGAADDMLAQYSGRLTNSDYLQAQKAVNDMKSRRGAAALTAQYQVVSQAKAKDMADRQTMASAWGYSDPSDPEFQQQYKQFKQSEYSAPDGVTFRRDPKTGILTQERANSTYGRGGANGASPATDFLKKSDQARTLGALLDNAIKEGNQKLIDKYEPLYYNLISGQNGTPSTPQGANSAFDVLNQVSK